MALINTPVQPFKTTAFVNRAGKGEFIEVDSERVDYMDISPSMVVSVVTAMIPFLENDDANRFSVNFGEVEFFHFKVDRAAVGEQLVAAGQQLAFLGMDGVIPLVANAALEEFERCRRRRAAPLPRPDRP